MVTPIETVIPKTRRQINCPFLDFSYRFSLVLLVSINRFLKPRNVFEQQYYYTKLRVGQYPLTYALITLCVFLYVALAIKPKA